MDYSTLSLRKKDNIYKQMQHIKIRNNLIKGRCFYNREDYTPVPVQDIMRILKSLNNSIANPKDKVSEDISRVDFLYDFLEIIQKAVAQGIESEIPENVKDFYTKIILPIVQSGRLKNKVRSLLENIHDPLFVTEKSYPWLRLDWPEPLKVPMDHRTYPTALHYYYYQICHNANLRQSILCAETTKELTQLLKDTSKRGIKFKHSFTELVYTYIERCSVEPYLSMLLNTGKRSVCYIDKDAYFGVVIRNNGVPGTYLQTIYNNLKIGKNKAGQAIMQARHTISLFHKPQRKRASEHAHRGKPYSSKKRILKTLVRRLEDAA